MAKTQDSPETAVEPGKNAVYVVKNMDVGNRDYPLKGGGTLYLPMKRKGAVWPKIKAGQISKALRAAEKTGRVQIIQEEVK